MRAVCIHGHYYQPPRENPWLGIVEREPSARPFHDWNDRITHECYAPNADVRTDRRVSNFARTSFDVGPTLHAWLAIHAPEVGHAIVEADRAQRGGMAQGYNHAILPLADGLTKEVQVRWGIADFTHRFGRAPEGLWLPETALDSPTLEVLARHGIRFAIVATHQIARVRPRGTERWSETVDPRRPYLCATPAGDVALFPYDGAFARAVAFEGALHDGRAFGARLAAAARTSDEAALVHLATDGESYGHHHPHGDMALAAALDEVERQGVPVVTYAAFLSAHPASWECEIAERTSWSCAHGVERWRAACGCAVHAGTSQAWRAPLRAAADHLWTGVRSALADVPDGERKLLEWIDVGLGARPARDVAGDAWLALETARTAQLAFTSCGWFFDDLDGLEGTQIVRYLARAAELLERWSRQPVSRELRSILADARTSDGATGATLFDRVLARDRATSLDLAALWARHVLSRSEPPAAASLAGIALDARDGSVQGEVALVMGESGEVARHAVLVGGEAWAGPAGTAPGTVGWRRVRAEEP